MANRKLQTPLTWCLILGGLLVGCAHAPAASEASQQAAPVTAAVPAGDTVAEAQGEPKKAVRVMVTGSRLPYYIQPGSSVPASTFGPLQSYTREDLSATGRDGNLGEMLRVLDPSITIHH